MIFLWKSVNVVAGETLQLKVKLSYWTSLDKALFWSEKNNETTFIYSFSSLTKSNITKKNDHLFFTSFIFLSLFSCGNSVDPKAMKISDISQEDIAYYQNGKIFSEEVFIRKEITPVHLERLFKINRLNDYCQN